MRARKARPGLPVSRLARYGAGLTSVCPSGGRPVPLYEATVVIDSTLEESVIEQKIKKITDLLTESGAKDIRPERRGVRKLAYSIKGKDGQKRTQADYTFFLFDAPGTAVRAVESQLRIDEDVLRYMTIRYDRLPVTPEGQAADGTVRAIVEEGPLDGSED